LPRANRLGCNASGAAAAELKFGLDETELELLRPADRHLSSDRRRGNRGEYPDITHVPIAEAAGCQFVVTEPFSAKVSV
jgi:hypothetical protein